MSTADKDADGSTDNSNSSESYDNDLVDINSIDEKEEWVDLEAAVHELWTPNSENMAQVGLLRDESGIIKFVSWESAELPEVEKGETYSFNTVVTDEHDDRFSVNLNKATTIEDLNKDLSADSSSDNNDDDSESYSNELVNCAEVSTDGEISEEGVWVDVEAEVDQLWDPNDGISQVGLLRDESGTVKFTSFETSDLPEVEEGKRYRFENVVSSLYNDNCSLNLNRTTEIEELNSE